MFQIKNVLHYFLAKKSSAETRRLLVQVYGEHVPSDTTCKEWFRRFKNGNFNVADKEHGKPPKKFKDDQLAAPLNENPSQTLRELAAALDVGSSTVSRRLHAIDMIREQGNWVPNKN